ncbi:MAG TPA: SCO family protein [Nocardioidaceae bacterium]|jgi:protein SCO1/2
MTPPARRARHLTLPLLVTLLCAVVAACGGDPVVMQGSADNSGGVMSSGGDPRFNGAEPATPYRMPDITLTATNGQPFNLITDTAYPVTLVFFGYTHCPDVCPLVMSDVAQTMLQLPGDVAHRTQFVFITTDPARDTPGVLREYLDHYNPDFVGLTGGLGDIVKAADAMGVAIEGRQQLPGGGYDVGHGAQVVGFRGNEAPVVWTDGTPISDMVSDIDTLAESAR